MKFLLRGNWHGKAAFIPGGVLLVAEREWYWVVTRCPVSRQRSGHGSRMVDGVQRSPRLDRRRHGNGIAPTSGGVHRIDDWLWVDGILNTERKQIKQDKSK